MPTEQLDGLDQAIAAQRLREEGPNELGVSQRRTLARQVCEAGQHPAIVSAPPAGSRYSAIVG